jgi:hypothetical protein
MIERVARAIADSDRVHVNIGLPKWKDMTEFNRNNYRFAAKAAIEAMREPTAAMKSRAAKECSTTDLASEQDFQEQYGDVWDAMIDAALGKPEL